MTGDPIVRPTEIDQAHKFSSTHGPGPEVIAAWQRKRLNVGTPGRMVHDGVAPALVLPDPRVVNRNNGAGLGNPALSLPQGLLPVAEQRRQEIAQYRARSGLDFHRHRHAGLRAIGAGWRRGHAGQRR
jgi:hypothetical protein